MTESIKVVLQTTIPATVNDWHVDRFSMLANLLAAQHSVDGGKLFEVVARNREAFGRPDPVLSTLEVSAYDEMWLFAVDTGDGLEAEDLAGIQRFRERDGGLLLTRDHIDLGCSIYELPEIGAAHNSTRTTWHPITSRRHRTTKVRRRSSGPISTRVRTGTIRR